MTQRFRIAGLTIESPVGLPVTPVRDGPEPDVRVRLLAPSPVPTEPLVGDRWQYLELGDHTVSMARKRPGIRLRYSAALEARYNATGSLIEIIRDPDFPEGMTEVLLGASLLAPMLMLRGHAVLHASAVTIQDRLVLLAGSSGQGKSTLAAALLSRGAGLVSDDLAPLAVRGDQLLLHPCSNVLRLRPDSAANRFVPPSDCRRSADNRLVWPAPQTSGPGPHQPALVLLPQIREDAQMCLQPQSPQQALIQLLTHGKRAQGIQNRDWRVTELQVLGQLAQNVPVALLQLPRDRLDPGLVYDLVSELL